MFPTADAENPLEASDASSPAVSASSDSILKTGTVDAPRPQWSPLRHQESSLAQEAGMEENLTAVESLGSHEGPNLVVKQVGSSLGRSRVKPLVIDSDSEEEGSSSDDCLPDGLWELLEGGRAWVVKSDEESCTCSALRRIIYYAM